MALTFRDDGVKVPPLKLELTMLLALFLIGCGVSEDSFAAQAADVGCSKAEECSPDSFTAVYGDQAECVDASTTLFEALYGCYIDNCETYDGGKASDCISEAKGMSCDDYNDPNYSSSACEDIWTECDDEAVNTCLATAMGF